MTKTFCTRNTDFFPAWKGEFLIESTLGSSVAAEVELSQTTKKDSSPCRLLWQFWQHKSLRRTFEKNLREEPSRGTFQEIEPWNEHQEQIYSLCDFPFISYSHLIHSFVWQGYVWYVHSIFLGHDYSSFIASAGRWSVTFPSAVMSRRPVPVSVLLRQDLVSLDYGAMLYN